MTGRDIKNAMEAKWRKKQIRIFIFAIGGWELFLCLAGLFCALTYGNFALSFEIVGLVAGVCLLIFAPFVLFYVYQYISLFRNRENFIVYEVVLDHPSTSYWYRGAVYYTVSFVTTQNIRVTADTKPLWSSGLFADFPLEEYNNQKIYVAYNDQTEMLIVLGRNALQKQSDHGVSP